MTDRTSRCEGLRGAGGAGPTPGHQDGAEGAPRAAARPATVDSDTMADAELTCPACGATIRARMAYPTERLYTPQRIAPDGTRIPILVGSDDDLRLALAEERARSDRLRDQVVEQAAAIKRLLAEQDGRV